MTYFKLKPEVYLIRGKKKSLLQNLTEEKILWIDNRLTNIIVKSELNAPLVEEEHELISAFFANYKWGIFSDTPIYIDKIRPINIFNEKKFHKNTPTINTAVLQITNTCNKSCDFCGKYFCPSCTVVENQEQSLSLDEWRRVIDSLEFYGIQTIMLTGGEACLSPLFDQMVSIVNGKKIKLSIHTNGTLSPLNIHDDNHLIISLFSAADLDYIVNKYNSCKIVTLIIYDNVVNPENIKKIPSNWQLAFSRTTVIPISKKSMVNVSFDNFFMRRISDKCLDKKISITCDGSVYPCMEFSERIGNVKDTEFHHMIKKLAENYWKVNVDMGDGKCTECEFRYACNACSLYDLNNCLYDVEEGKWK